MDRRIAIISPNETIVKQTKVLLDNRGLSFPVYEATRHRALEIARECIEQGARIIISRGGTAAYLKRMLDVPVVEIQFTFFDFTSSIQKAMAYSSKIAMIGASSAFISAQRSRRFLGNEVRIIHIGSHDNIDYEIEEQIKTLKKQGIEVVIGGSQVVTLSKNHGLQAVMTEVDENSIALALDEALYNLRLEMDQEEKYETIQSILSCASEGIIGVDLTGRITNINNTARKLLRVADEDSESNIKNLIPNVEIIDSVLEGQEIVGAIFDIGGTSIVLNSVPIVAEKKIVGAVAVIQESTRISMLDQKIRKRLIEKGHFARAHFHTIKGNSSIITATKEKAKKYSQVDSTLLILGETGTGKELFAQSIHNYSSRRNNPFVAINCAAIPQNLLESALFGYVKGAFTGANSEGRPGIFETANTGTIFLDEISEISHDVQVRLLRVIQERQVTRVGDDKIISVDVRIIAASNKNLLAEIEEKKFRDDLYYRISVLQLELPPLRLRTDDIGELAHHFLKEHTQKHKRLVHTITPGAIELLKALEWPGNVRQLSNVMERMIVITENDTIDEELVTEATESMAKGKQSPYTRSRPSQSTGMISLVEKELIRKTLQDTAGNKTEAARILGISKSTLWRKLNSMED